MNAESVGFQRAPIYGHIEPNANATKSFCEDGMSSRSLGISAMNLPDFDAMRHELCEQKQENFGTNKTSIPVTDGGSFAPLAT